MTFPLKPLLDRVIVREIPVKEYFRIDEQSSHIDLDNENIKVLSDRGSVEAVGMNAATHLVVGDIVMFDEFARNDEIYLNPADKYRSDLPRYFQIRVADLKGVDVAQREKLVTEYQQKQAQAIEEAQLKAAAADVSTVN
jgi:co-chaperonin GroES (HSP10)